MAFLNNYKQEITFKVFINCQLSSKIFISINRVLSNHIKLIVYVKLYRYMIHAHFGRRMYSINNLSLNMFPVECCCEMLLNAICTVVQWC